MLWCCITAAVIYAPEVFLAAAGKIHLQQKLKQFGITESRESAISRLGIKHGGNGRTFEVMGVPNPENSPIGTWTNSLILGMIEGDGTNWPVHLTDNYGFFNNQEWWANPKILIIGDSFVTCEHLQTNSITRLVRNSVSPAVNIGITGGGPLVELAGLKAHWSKISNSVNLVVWCYYEGNDLQDAAQEYTSPFFSRALDPSFSLVPDQSLLRQLPSEVDSKGHGWKWALKTVATFSRTRLFLRYYRKDSRSASIIGHAVREAKRFTGKPVLLIRIRRGDTYVRQLDYEWDVILAIAHPDDHVDMAVGLAAYTPTKVLAHYNHHGYDLLCEQIKISYDNVFHFVK